MTDPEVQPPLDWLRVLLHSMNGGDGHLNVYLPDWNPIALLDWRLIKVGTLTHIIKVSFNISVKCQQQPEGQGCAQTLPYYVSSSSRTRDIVNSTF